MKTFRWYDHIAINLFWFGLNIRNNAIGYVFMPYLVALFVTQDVLNSSLGALRTAGLIIAMLVQPAIGLLSDRSTSRFGRRRPFIFVGVLFDLLFLALIAVSSSFWMLLIAILFIQFSSNVSHGALQGLIPDMVPEKQRGVSSAVKAILELIPLVLYGMTISKLVEAGEFGWAVFATGAVLLVVMLLTMVFVKEKPLTEKSTEPIGPPMLRVLGMLAGIILGALAGVVGGAVLGGIFGGVTLLFSSEPVARSVGVGLGGILAMAVAVIAGVWAGTRTTLGREALSHRSFNWWVTNRLLYFTAITSILTYTPYFLMFTFKMTIEEATGATGSLTTVVGGFTVVSALASGFLANRFNHRLQVWLSGWIGAVGTVLILATILAPNMTLLYIAGCVLGVSAGMFNTANWALGCSLVPPDKAGRYLGISNLAGAGAGMVGTGLGGLIADIVNGAFAGLGYFVLFAGYALLFVLSSLILRGVEKIKVA
jgi:MFS family permease